MNKIEKRNLKFLSIVSILTVLIGLIIFVYVDVFALLAVSILIAMIFYPIVSFLEKRKIPRVVTIITIFILTGVLLFSAVSILIPKIVNQFEAIANSLNDESIKNSLANFDKSVKEKFPVLSSINISEKITTFISDNVLGWINNLSVIVQGLFSVLAVIVIIPFMTFFILKDSEKMLNSFLGTIHSKYFEVSKNVLTKIGLQLSRYVRGWILDAAIVGILAGIGIALLGINNAISIGFVAGIGHLIPYFGPIIGGLPAIVISIIQFGDLSMLPGLLIMFAIIYIIDNGFIQPNIFSKSTDMHPLVIIVLILIGSQTFGMLGMLLAVPLATVIKTAIKEIYNGYKNFNFESE